MTWLGQQLAACGQAVRQTAKAPFTSLLNTLVIGIALSLPLGLYTLVINLAQLAGDLPAQNEIVVYFREQATKAEIEQLMERLKVRNGAKLAKQEWVSRETAMNQMKSKGFSEVLESLPSNPLPDTLVLTPVPASADELQTLARELRAEPSVDHILFDDEWAARLQSFLRFGRELTWLLSAALGGALIAVAGNAIRMQILQRRAEVEITKLIGGTNQFIRRPFVYFGLLQGIAGGVAGCLLVALGLHQLNPAVTELAQQYGSHFLLVMPDPLELVLAVSAVTILCWAGAVLAVNRFLGQFEPK